MLLANRLTRDLNPWRMLQEIEQQWNQHFGEWSAAAQWTHGTFRFWSGDGSAVLEFDLPGCDPNAIDVSVHKNVLTVETKAAEASDGGDAIDYHLRERTPVATREFRLPFDVDPSKTEAEYRNGVLRLKLHQPEAHRPTKISIRGS